MKPTLHWGALRRVALWPALLCPAWVVAQALNLSQVPLFLGTSVKPNLMVVYDNSQSMDGTMAGQLVAGDNAQTRGNIARGVLRDTITAYRSLFNWGLTSFELKSSQLYTTYGYYFGSANGVVYTNDCVAGVSASRSGRRCIANPQTANGYQYLTYDRSGDDADINDVLYINDIGPQLYGIGSSGTAYDGYTSRRSAGAWNDWSSGSFSSFIGNLVFTPTDAGFLPTAADYPRIFWLRRAWGYYSDITGKGKVNQGVAADSSSQFDALMAQLAAETGTLASTELKNAAVFTPLAGTLGTVKDYFGNALAGQASPISQSCQANFVLLATDGMPTGKSDGSMYATSAMGATQNPSTGEWTFGQAATDVFSKVSALRSTNYSGNSYDVQTYVIGLGESVSNAGALATLDRMAELGGTRSAFRATDQAALAQAMRDISVDILARTGAAASVSLNSGSWSAGAKVYQGRFNSADWSGQLAAYALDASGSPSGTADWQAANLLAGRHWSSSRQIFTYKPSAALGSRGVPLRWPANPAAPTATEIDPGMVTLLNRNSAGTTDNFGQQRLEYLRGNSAREARNCASCAAPVFRSRPVTVLGDIVNSAPTYVGGATADYRDTLEASRYSSYVQARSSTTPLLFVGANDGLLHAFNANTGAEVFAYLPYAVRNRLPALTAEPYTHVFSVDGTPSVGDAYVGGAWKTLLVSGMSAGAPGLFALDVSNAAAATEASANQVVRWELGDSDADVGHIFSQPILAKTRDGRWRAIVGNGYNSANGHAVLLLVDLETGAVQRLDTGVGSAATPNGLSGVTAVSSNDSGVVDLVYAGDLRGNLWKFDLSSTSTAGWKVAYGTTAVPAPLFTAATGQAITARPDITRAPKGGYMISFGTGRYVDISDNAAGSTQALYGIWDQGSATSLAALQTQSVVTVLPGASGRNYRISTHAVGLPADLLRTGDNLLSASSYYSSKRGWKLDLPSSGERVVTSATVRAGRLVVSTLIPGASACTAGGDGWVMDLDVFTGNRAAALDTNNDGLVDAADHLGGNMAAGVQVGSVPTAASIMRSANRKLDDKLINTSAGTILKVREAGSSATSRRSAWEQLQ